jgi:hypothetical protein
LDARISDSKRELPAGCEVHNEAICPGTACCIGLLGGTFNATEAVTDWSCGVFLILMLLVEASIALFLS